MNIAQSRTKGSSGSWISGSPQTVFLLRHGESFYNAGGPDKHIPFLARKYKDAPLTEKGLHEAQSVAEKLEALLNGTHAPGTPEEEALVALTESGGCAFASPLTRAVQTALVALGPLFRRRPELRLVLDPNLRESVDTVHWDSVGDSHLEDIKRKAMTKLGELGVAGRSAAEAASSVIVDASATSGQWWSTSEESHEDLNCRITAFLHTVRTSTCPVAVLAGHSSLFRDTFRDFWEPGPESYVPAWFRGTSQEWLTAVRTRGATKLATEDLRSRKLMNLGMAAMSLEGPADHPVLKQVRLMLDTRIQELKYKECADGMGWRLSEDGQSSKKGKPYCACRWGLVCSSPGSECQQDMSEWPYPQSNNIFRKDCQSCSCQRL
jgi:broad specificity phosphatase PhoE